MHLTELEFGEHLQQRLEPLLEVLQVDVLTLLDQREHDIHLSALVDLLADALVQTGCLIVVFMECYHWLPARRQLINHTHVEVAIDGHGQRTGNRRGRHYQYMRRVHTLAPQLGPLRHTEAVLLIHHHEP